MATSEDVSVESAEQLARDLYDAVVFKNIDRVRSLLGEGADPNHDLYQTKEWGSTSPTKIPPLHKACIDGWLEMIKTLVDHGADKDLRDNSNRTPLHHACSSLGANKDVVEYLVEKANCDVNVTDDLGLTPFDYARGVTEITDYLKSRQKSAQQGASRKRAHKSSETGKLATKKRTATKEIKERPKVTKQTRTRRKH